MESCPRTAMAGATRYGLHSWVRTRCIPALPMETISIPASLRKPQERRRTLRVTPDPFLVIRLSSGNSGVVLDVSRDGLGFLASSPLEETGTLRFEIAGRTTAASAAAGQLMWKDVTGKRAGVRFTQLPEDLRELLGRYLPSPEVPVLLKKERKMTGPPILAFEEPVRSGPRFHAKGLAFAANVVTALLACCIALGIWHSVNRPAASGGAAKAKPGVERFVSFLRSAYWRTPFSRAHENTTEVPRQRSKNAALPVPANIPFPLPFPAERTSTPLAAVANLPAFQSAVPVAAESAKPEPAQAGKPVAPAISEDPGQTALAQARELLRKDADPERQAKAAQLLWKAVEKGNVPAEVELADLYLLGQGVAKSCGQARVLLTSAQLRKSATAAKKLDDFPLYGCE